MSNNKKKDHKDHKPPSPAVKVRDDKMTDRQIAAKVRQYFQENGGREADRDNAT